MFVWNAARLGDFVTEPLRLDDGNTAGSGARLAGGFGN
jgi:hypothetical protein